MARRTDHSRDELFELVLDEADKIIQQSGVAALTARSIAAAIGYSPGTLYNLFDNIDDIILHLNIRTMDDLYEQLAAAVDGATGRTALDRFITAYLHYNKNSRQRWQLLFEHRLPDSVEPPDWYLERTSTLLDLLSDTMYTMLPDCGQRELEHSARVLWAGLHGICSMVGAHKLPKATAHSLDEMARSMVYNYISGLRRAG